MSKKKHVVLAVTGSRPNKLIGGYPINSPSNLKMQNYFKMVIEKALDKFETVHCISGGALGADTLWALAVLSVKEQYPSRVTLEMAIPFTNQDCKWPASSQTLYQQLISSADIVTNVSKQDSYIPAYMQRRNEYMVDQCDYLFAIYNGTTGGTHNCVQYAKSKNKSITINSSFHRK